MSPCGGQTWRRAATPEHLFAGGGHYLLIQAFRRAQASVLAPYGFVALVWVTILGYLVFGDFPDGFTIAGALTVVSSGIYVFYRESVVKRVGPRA